MARPDSPAPDLQDQPVFGLPVDLAALSAKRPVAVIFQRYLGSAHARTSLVAINGAYPAYDLEGVAVVAITDSPLPPARDFVTRYQLLFPLVCDPERAHFTAWEVPTGGPADLAKAALTGALTPRALSLGHGRVDGRWSQRPAAYVVRDGQIRWSWEAPHAFSVLDPAEPLRAALSRRSARQWDRSR